MPNPYTPDGSSYNATHSLIDGGDSPSAVIINTPMESLADNVEFLKLSQNIPVNLIRVHPVIVFAGGSPRRIPEDIIFDFDDLSWGVVTIANTVSFDMPLIDLPDKSTITKITLRVKGTGFSTLPTTKPILTCEFLDDSGVTNSMGSPVEDASADVTAFNLPHPIQMNVSESINHEGAPKSIYLNLIYDGTGSSGGTAFVIHKITCSYTPTQVNP